MKDIEAAPTPVPAPITPEVARQSRPPHKRKHHLPYLLAGLLLLVQGCATAPPATRPTPASVEKAHAQAKAAYLAHDYQRTLAIVEPLARAGEPWAQYTLGYMYHYGRGVTKNRQTAQNWIQRAAAQGYVPAQQALLRLSPRPPPAEADMNPSPKGGTAQSTTAGEDKRQPQQPPSQAATDTAKAPSAAVAMSTTAKQGGAGAEPSVPRPPQMTPAARATESTVPQETASAVTPATGPPAAPPPELTPPPAKAGAAGTASTVEKPDKGVNGHDWIAAQDPKHFTVQLIGVSNESAAIRFIHKHALEDQAAYYSTTRNGNPWFAVVYGSFTSPSTARQALRRLPSSLRSASPWIRTFGKIQAVSTP